MPSSVRVLLILSAIVVMCAVGFLAVNEKKKLEALPEFNNLPPFVLHTQDELGFSNEDLLDKISVVDFIFTRCKGPCPVMAVNMGQLYQDYATKEDVQFVSISVDPENDSYEVLKAYAKLNNVYDNRWQFLRGDIDSVAALCENGFKLPAEDLPGMHSVKFVLIDTKGIIRGYYSGVEQDDMKLLKRDIETLIDGLD